MKHTWRWAPTLLVALGLVLTGVVAGRQTAGADSAERLPDLQTVIPTSGGKEFSIVNSGGLREFRYTHLIYNNGPDSLEVQPAYDQISGGYRGEQLIYAKINGAWSLSRRVPVPDTFVFHAAHGHFHFPLASFGLYRVGPGDSVGDPVAVSPKIGFCIDDSYIFNHQVADSGYNHNGHGSCADPESRRGLSVGGADEYDYRDPGQAIPINGLADGTYWFRAVSDPFNDFVEANESNNEKDVKVTITGSTVTIGAQRTPDTTPPPVVLNAPAEGAPLAGTTWLTASSTAPEIAEVSFLVDGAVVGTVTSAPYTMPWNSADVVDGEHWFAARITDRARRSNTTAVHVASVHNSAPTSDAGLRIVASNSADDDHSATAQISAGLAGGDRLVALVASDGPGTGLQTAALSGTAGASALSWQLVKRANGKPGAAEIWTATVPSGATGVSATASLAAATAGYDVSLSLLALRGAAGVGVSAATSGSSGSPGAKLTSTSAGSRVFAVGSDWDRAEARQLPAGQELLHEWRTSVGDTLWAQAMTDRTAAAGQSVSMSTGPASAHWNYAAVEITATSPGDTSPPRVRVSDPEDAATVTGNVRVAAGAADDVGVTRVDFLVDGSPVGSSTEPPFVMTWDSRTVGGGTHQVVARARDAAGNVGTSAPVAITVDNSHRPPAVIKVDAKSVGRGTSTATTDALRTTGRGRLLLAMVAFNGPEGGAQTSTVSGGGLIWTRVNTISAQTGGVEIWSAYAPQQLTDLQVSAKAGIPGYAGGVTVLALSGAAATGVSGVSAQPKGASSIYLPGVNPASWVLAVGFDADGADARTVPAGQQIVEQWLDPDATYWVQALSAPTTASGLVTLSATGPDTHQWNLAAVEVKAAGLVSLRPGRPGLPSGPQPTITRAGRPGHHG